MYVRFSARMHMLRRVSPRQARARVAKMLRPAMYRILQAFTRPWPESRDVGKAYSPAGGQPGEGLCGAECFFFGPRDADRILSLLEKKYQREGKLAVKEAEKIRQLRFTFRGHPEVRFSYQIDWEHRPDGDLEWLRELNRFPFAPVLARAHWNNPHAGYGVLLARILADWMKHNPPGGADTWDPFSAATRLWRWLWSCNLLSSRGGMDCGDLSVFEVPLAAHAQYVYRHIEYDVANNHLIFQGKVLLTAGILLRAFKGSARWLDRGREIFWNEFSRQVHPDGVSAEQSAHYHVQVAMNAVEMLLLSRRNGLDVPLGCVDRLRNMARFADEAAGPDGAMPPLGDSSLQNPDVRYPGYEVRHLLSAARLLFPEERWVHAPSQIPEEIAWLWGFEALDFPPDPGKEGDRDRAALSTAFPEGGYCVMRSGYDAGRMQLLFDCGPLGLPSKPGHGHADLLAVNLWAFGTPFLQDPGAYEYRSGPWRSHFRGTAAHSTVGVDGCDQADLWDAFRVGRMPQTSLDYWSGGELLDLAVASHDGYMRLPGRVLHRRHVIFVKPDYWIIRDDIEGGGTHELEVLFQFTADVENVERCGHTGQVDARRGDDHLTLAFLDDDNGQGPNIYRGSTDPVRGWSAPSLGKRIPAYCVTYRATTDLPHCFWTLLIPWQGHNRPALKIRNHPQTGGIWDLHLGENEDVFIYPQSSDLIACSGEIEFRGRFCLVRYRCGEVRALSAKELRHLKVQNLIAVESAEPISLFESRLEDGRAFIRIEPEHPGLRLSLAGSYGCVLNDREIARSFGTDVLDL